MSRNRALDIGRAILALVSKNTVGVHLEHTVRAVTKIVDHSVQSTDDGDYVDISFQSLFGTGIPVTIATNQIDDSTLKYVVSRAEAMLPSFYQRNQADDDGTLEFTYNDRPHLPVSLWHDATAQAMESSRGEALSTIVKQMADSRLNGAATIGCASRSVLHLYKYGLTAFAEETDCEVTVTARTPDGTGSGWAGEASRDWASISPSRVTQRAIELAQKSQQPVALEPGRRVAILGPAAVAQLVVLMARYFDEFTAIPGVDRWSPFSNVNYKKGERRTKLGSRVFDRRLVFMSDPADPLGGYPPFYERGGVEIGVLGFPTQAVTWVDAGVLNSFAYSVSAAVSRDLPACDIPSSVRVTTVPGTQTATIDDMIRACTDGVYVNRFSDVSIIPTIAGYNAGMMTGVTRDGCFLVKNGKIDKPIKNFRFTDSPFFAFNRLEIIGSPERVAFGYDTVPADYGSRRRWPRLPVIVPPMMIRDFNFSALIDAI